MDFIGLSGVRYSLESASFSGGGEGDIYAIIGNRDKCAKIYHPSARSVETEEKLKVMVNNPPEQSILTQIAWPLDILYSSNGSFAGFVMPKINVSDELISIYEYPPTKYQRITFEHKLIIAQNICAVIDGVHKAGFVFGDFNPKNIGINMNTGHVAFWDTDSYHIYDKMSRKTYRCKVCLDGYVAPELIALCKKTNPVTGKTYDYESAPLDTFTQATDNFALAIHIFKLFMNGYTPFAGMVANRQLNSTIAPGIGNTAIERDQYCFKSGNVHISKAVPDKSVLPIEISRLFDRAFIDGRNDPKARPTARDWYIAIENFYKQLEQCKVNPSHQYIKGLNRCPWCEIDKRFNVGIKKTQAQMNNAVLVAPVPATTLTNRIAPANSPAQSYSYVSKKKIMRTELIVLAVCIILIFGFYIRTKAKWENKLTPEGYIEHGNVVSNWKVDDPIDFTGTLDSGNVQDRYTVTLEDSYNKKRYNVEFFAITSNEQILEIEVSNNNGDKEVFNSGDSNRYSDGYVIALTAGETYTINVKCESGLTDYLLRIQKD